VILVDTGPLVALLDRNDSNHSRCVEASAALPVAPLLTSWPCLTEAMYLIGRRTGAPGQESLWGMIQDSLLEFWNIEPAQVFRMAELMRQYRDLPMDIADAALVVAAECTGTRQVFTLDGHFRIYRLKDGSVLEVVP
jgi:uncharacterized protein